MPVQRIINKCPYVYKLPMHRCPDFDKRERFCGQIMCNNYNFSDDKCDKKDPQELFGYALSDEEVRDIIV